MKYIMAVITLFVFLDFFTRVGWPVAAPKDVTTSPENIKELTRVEQDLRQDNEVLLWGKVKVDETDSQGSDIFEQATVDSIHEFGNFQVLLYALAEQSGEQHAFLWLKNKNGTEQAYSIIVRQGEAVEGAVAELISNEKVILVFEGNRITLEIFKRV